MIFFTRYNIIKKYILVIGPKVKIFYKSSSLTSEATTEGVKGPRIRAAYSYRV